MATRQGAQILRHLRRAVLLRDGAGLTDAQLLERFVNHREEAAVEAIVRRHGPMVMGVCRRILGNRHDAEDAFQATFLILVRKAGALVARELLANWLYGVAYNTARKARAVGARRRRREKPLADLPEPEAVPPDPWDALRHLIDQEVNRLPDKYRTPVVLCDLEGKTHQEAAAQLGWPVGTLSGRLARARAMLAGRLTRRGLTLSGATLGAVLSAGSASARVPAATAATTVNAACLFAAGRAGAGVISAEVACLTEGVLRSMHTATIKPLMAVLLGAALLAAGGGRLTGRGHGPDTDPPEGLADGAAVGRLIDRLGSPRFKDREAATNALAQIGEPALPSLRRAAAAAKDLETLRRVEKLIRAIEGRWELRRFDGHADAVPGAALSPDGRLALSAGRSESSPRLWDVATGKELRRLGGHSSWVWDVAFTSDGRRALSCGVDGLLLWDVATGKALRSFPARIDSRIPMGHTRQVYRVALSADGKRALSGSQDNTVRLWELETGKELYCFRGHTDEVQSVAISPDGGRGLSCSADGTMRLWDVKTGKELHRLPGAACAVFSPDGKRLLSAGRDHLVRLWDAEAGKELRRFAGHTKEAYAVAFSRDGKRALSGGEDLTVRLWDVRTGKELRCLRGHTAGPSRVTFTPDGTRALSASYDGTLRLWALPPDVRPSYLPGPRGASWRFGSTRIPGRTR
jgi:RNA polymerase sigma factor (sigma-70 family)